METDSLIRDPQTLPQHRLGRGERGPGAASQVVITPELSSLLLRAQHVTNSEPVIFTPILGVGKLSSKRDNHLTKITP